MDEIKQSLTPEEEQLIAAKENYQQIKRVIKLWQQEQDPAWLDSLQLGSSPGFSLADLPSEVVIEVWQRLNQAVGEHVEPEDLELLWQSIKSGKSIQDYALASRLHLALAGIAQLVAGRLALPEYQEDQPFGPCPVCGEEEFIATLVPPVGKRFLSCKVCGHARPVKISGCAHCGSDDAKKQVFLHSEEFPGVEMVACLDCGRSFKQLDLRELSVNDLIWEDIRTLPLNYAAEQWFVGQTAQNGKLQ